MRLALTLSALLACAPALIAQDAPHLEIHGPAGRELTQLIVDGKPFFMIAGELRNSSSSSLDYMKPIWPRLTAISLNTVLTPISWELIEPTEGTYDFSLIDGLLAQARQNHVKVVFLWLAAWKNGVSSYEPVWVKRDTKRFPRVYENGNPVTTLSSFSPALKEADARAFAAVMQHIKEVDSAHTVLMMQVENEVGILGSPRDHSAAAERAFAGAVPEALTSYLKGHRESLDPELSQLWRENGEKTAGAWTEVFGNSARADEIFMAWQYGLYVHTVAAKGKAAYNIPMYVNCWLGGGDDVPGSYPSGGPQPRVIDIWKAAGASLGKKPSIDLYAPDLYKAEFADWSKRYHRDGNPFFIPETNGGENGAANIFYALGEQAAMGFSPFAIDSAREPEKDLGPSYKAIAEIAPLVLAKQAADAGNVHGFILDKGHPSVEFVMHGNTVQVSLDEIFGYHAEKGFGLIIATGQGEGQDEFVGAGKGFRVLITPRSPTAPRIGIASIDEGHFSEGKWLPGRRLNGDETDQGNYWRFDQRDIHIEKATFYRYE
jgi:beta-galactosidase GanA